MDVNEELIVVIVKMKKSGCQVRRGVKVDVNQELKLLQK